MRVVVDGLEGQPGLCVNVVVADIGDGIFNTCVIDVHDHDLGVNLVRSSCSRFLISFFLCSVFFVFCFFLCSVFSFLTLRCDERGISITTQSRDSGLKVNFAA